MKSPVARARENEHMYIDPKIHILRNVLIAATGVLVIALFIFFIVKGTGENGVVRNDTAETVTLKSISGVLETNNATPSDYLINEFMVLNAPDLSEYRGKKVVLTGVEGKLPNTILYKTIIELPQPVQEKKTVTNFFTAHSNYSFVFEYGGDTRLFHDVSKSEEARVQLNDASGNTIMEFMRTKDDASLTSFIGKNVAVASKEQVRVGGFPFELERVIPLDGNGLIERAVRSSKCEKKERCPSFTAVLYNATNPDNEHLFRSLLLSLVFLPEPQGWKLYTQHIDGAKWDFYLYYPSKITLATDESGNNNFTSEDGTLVLTLNVFTTVPNPPTDAEKETLLLPTRKETLYHLPNQDRMLLKMPEGNGAVELFGKGPVFDAMIRTFTFVQ